MTIRKYIKLVENRESRYQYIGNCTDQTNAPFLEDMMDHGKKVAYQEVYNAVGRDTLKSIFPQFVWDAKPNRKRGQMALHQDPYVSFYKSRFRGFSCYYIRESGVEFIFVEPGYDENTESRKLSAQRFYILKDGTITKILRNGGEVSVTVVIVDHHFSVIQSSKLTAPVAQSLLEIINKYKPTQIFDDPDETDDTYAEPVADYIAFVKDSLIQMDQ